IAVYRCRERRKKASGEPRQVQRQRQGRRPSWSRPSRVRNDLDVPCDGFEQLRVLDRDRRRGLALERLAVRMWLVIPGRDLVAMEGNDLGKGIVQLFGRQFGGQRLGGF